MSGFDFREALGGKVEVPDDPALADGATATDAPGLHAHMTQMRPGISLLIDHVCQGIIATSNINQICTAALFALVFKRLADTAIEHLPPDVGPEQRAHVIAEMRAMLDQLERAGG